MYTAGNNKMSSASQMEKLTNHGCTMYNYFCIYKYGIRSEEKMHMGLLNQCINFNFVKDLLI